MSRPCLPHCFYITVHSNYTRIRGLWNLLSVALLNESSSSSYVSKNTAQKWQVHNLFRLITAAANFSQFSSASEASRRSPTCHNTPVTSWCCPRPGRCWGPPAEGWCCRCSRWKTASAPFRCNTVLAPTCTPESEACDPTCDNQHTHTTFHRAPNAVTRRPT